jgi:AcrR family transcriptional regulator
MPKVITDLHIFQAVMEIIAERGYAGATTREIAEAAGVSEMTLFRKYGSKAELIKRAISALVEQTEFESTTQYTGDIRTDLLRVLQAYQKTVILHERFFFALVAEFSHTPELTDSFSQPLELFHSIGKLLARYQSEGVLKAEYPLHSVACLLGPLLYFSMVAQSVGGASVPPMEIETVVENFLGGRYASMQAPKSS